ncbi:MAG: hypothetical protein U0900_17320 [Myxococcota bacterium]
MLDAVHLEEQGTPSLTFVTQPFESAARTHARLRAMPDIPLVIIPSDYLDRSDEAVAAKLEPMIERIIDLLCGVAGPG